jgi:hypothetical protein
MVQNAVKRGTESQAGLLTNEPFSALVQQYFWNRNLARPFWKGYYIFPLTGANNDKEIRIKTRRTHVHM